MSEANRDPLIVILKSRDVSLAKISPMKIAKALNDAGKNYVKAVSKTRADKLKRLDTLGL